GHGAGGLLGEAAGLEADLATTVGAVVDDGGGGGDFRAFHGHGGSPWLRGAPAGAAFVSHPRGPGGTGVSGRPIRRPLPRTEPGRGGHTTPPPALGAR